MDIKKIVSIIVISITFLSAQSWNQILSDYAIVDIEVYSGGYWVATESNGALRYDTASNQWFRYNQDNGIMSQNDHINDMKIMGGKVWFATNYGIYTCSKDGGNWQHKLLPPGDYFSNWVRDFDSNSDKIYIASFQGLYTCSISSYDFTAHDISISGNYQTSYTNSIFATDSLVWIGTDDGVICYNTSKSLSDASSRTYYSKSNGISTTSDLVMCRSLYANEQGLWLGLDEYTSTTAPNYCMGGLFHFDFSIWTKHDQSTGLPADGIHFIQEYDGKIYSGLFHYIDGVNFEGAGLLVMDLEDNSWEVLDDLNWHISNKAVRSFYCNETDTIVGTDHGLFTNLSALPDLKPYDRPEWFSLRSLGDNKVEIIIDEVYLADSYAVFYSVLGDANVDTLYLDSHRDTLIHLLQDTQYSFQVAGKNEFGFGPKCLDMLSIRIGSRENDILLIQGFDKDEPGNSYDYSCMHGKYISDAGSCFDAISDEALIETAINILDYKMIDWICGVDYNVLTDQHKVLIKNYLEAGGNLFISGSQIIEGITGENLDQAYYNTYFKANWKKSDARTYTAHAIPGSIFDGIGEISFDDGSMGFNVERPDGFTPLGGAKACLLYAEKDSSSYGSAALQYTGTFGESIEEAQLVYMGFPLESVMLESTRNALMLCVLDYFRFEVTLTGRQEINIPRSLVLEQNYPNPFNPITTISYQLSADSNVELNIYDLNGCFITDLINEHQDAGDHEIHFNGSGLSSGVYICRLQAGNVVRSMKMLLLK
jgi:hypothetical protein